MSRDVSNGVHLLWCMCVIVRLIEKVVGLRISR